MKNKFNKRRVGFIKKPRDLSNKSVNIEVQVLSDLGATENEILVIDSNGIIVSLPTSILKANQISIENRKIKLSQSLYDTWFKIKYSDEVSYISKRIYNNFEKIVEHSNLILNDHEFRQIQLPFLKSTILYNGSITYPLGRLLYSWTHDDELKISESMYMLKINVSPLSGINNYIAYSTKMKSLCSGTLDKNDKNWRLYFDEFYSFADSNHPSNQLMVLTRLLIELGID